MAVADAEVWQPYLDPGEPLLWTGRPSTRFNFLPGDWIAIPVGVAFGTSGLFFLLLGLVEGQINGILGGCLTILIALHTLVWRYVHRYRLRRRTRYAITPRRALILHCGRQDRLREMPISPRMPSETHFGERGHIWLGLRPSWVEAQHAGAFGCEPPGFQFAGIPDVRKVHDLIRRLREGATA